MKKRPPSPREARKAIGLSQTELAQKSGLSQQVISGYERGAVPSVLDAIKLANALGLAPTDLSYGPEIARL